MEAEGIPRLGILMALAVVVFSCSTLPVVAAADASVHSPPRIQNTTLRNFSGTITAISATSFTFIPKVTDSTTTPSTVTITVDGNTKIVMRGNSDATLSNLAVGYEVLVSKHLSGPTLVLVSPRDVPVESAQHDQEP